MLPPRVQQLHQESLGSPKSLTVPASLLLSYLPSLSSQAKASSGLFGCQATVKVGDSHCTSQSFSPAWKRSYVSLESLQPPLLLSSPEAKHLLLLSAQGRGSTNAAPAPFSHPVTRYRHDRRVCH